MINVRRVRNTILTQTLSTATQPKSYHIAPVSVVQAHATMAETSNIYSLQYRHMSQQRQLSSQTSSTPTEEVGFPPTSTSVIPEPKDSPPPSFLLAQKYSTLLEEVLQECDKEAATLGSSPLRARIVQWHLEAKILRTQLEREGVGANMPAPQQNVVTDGNYHLNGVPATPGRENASPTSPQPQGQSEPAPLPPHPPVNVFVSTDAELEAVFVTRKLGSISVGNTVSRTKPNYSNGNPAANDDNHSVDTWATQQAVRVHLKIKRTHDGRQVPYSLLNTPTMVGADRWVEIIGVESFPTVVADPDSEVAKGAPIPNPSATPPLVLLVGSLKVLKSAQLLLKNIALTPSWAIGNSVVAAQQQLSSLESNAEAILKGMMPSSIPPPDTALPCIEVCGGAPTTAHISNSLLCGGRDGIFLAAGAKAIVSGHSVVAFNVRGLFEGHRCSLASVGSTIIHNKFQLVLLGTYEPRGYQAPFECERIWLEKADAMTKVKKRAETTASETKTVAANANHLEGSQYASSKSKGYFRSLFSVTTGSPHEDFVDQEENQSKSFLHKDHATVTYEPRHHERRRERVQFFVAMGAIGPASEEVISQTTLPPNPHYTTISHFAFSHNPVADSYGKLYNRDGTVCKTILPVDATAGLSEPGW